MCRPAPPLLVHRHEGQEAVDAESVATADRELADRSTSAGWLKRRRESDGNLTALLLQGSTHRFEEAGAGQWPS